ncbi:MAG: malto-oligosyltrehalose trehalohydrolase, partial [Candidatus Omnitrophica bacterium]|nr:malto-oligosyltrehalose trehalohydrolase [Candidatus Omnitrophota bacterium]
MRIGAFYSHAEEKCDFTVWAPLLEQVAVSIEGAHACTIPMQKDEYGYWHATLNEIAAQSNYRYELNGHLTRPDPASFFQPDGVHGVSQLVDHAAFHWADASWKGIPLEAMIIYELHIGTFTAQGTFEGIIKQVDTFRELGVNAIELMPVAQFPGARNWGYDGAYPFAVQNSYGGPQGLKNLVNTCHKKNLAVILDVVYNHLGPEGNYLADFGPYFTDKYRTAWGKAVNFDDAYSFGARNFFIQNALYWLKEYHIDALRLDAIHGIFDMGAKHILQELSEEVGTYAKKAKRDAILIAESDLNDARIIRPKSLGGYGINGQWCDEFHHCLHTVLTQEKSGYYQDFGSIEQLKRVFKEGFVYTGEYSRHRKRFFGNSYNDRETTQLVVFSQNHDQVGNRMKGERLSSLVNFESLKLAACGVIFSPFVPLLFMGEEYGEEAPFLYFVSHGDESLIQAVREGRKKEFSSFSWQGECPDPQAEKTFFDSRLNAALRNKGHHQALFGFYKKLIQLRKKIPALSHSSGEHCRV